MHNEIAEIVHRFMRLSICVFYYYPDNRYVENPSDKLMELAKKGGDMPPILRGKIVAGDAVELQVVKYLPYF